MLTVWAHERSAGELGAPVLAPAASLERIARRASRTRPGDACPGGIEA